MMMLDKVYPSSETVVGRVRRGRDGLTFIDKSLVPM
jgi:hypothetical protein